jgi:hypothetical protein
MSGEVNLGTMVLNYQGSALPSKQEKGLVIATITARMWNDEEFYNAVRAYAESARADLYGSS